MERYPSCDFLQLATRHFPKWMHVARQKNKIALSVSPAEFWENIAKESLKEHGFDQEAWFETQRNAISDIILQTTQGRPCAATLLEYILAAPFNKLPTSIVDSLDIVLCGLTQGEQRVRRYQEVTKDVIPIEAFTNPTCPIVKAFITYQTGKQHVKAYKRKLKQGNVTTSLVSGVATLMKNQNRELLRAHDNGEELAPKDFKTYMAATAKVLEEFDKHVSDVHMYIYIYIYYFFYYVITLLYYIIILYIICIHIYIYIYIYILR